MNQDAERNPEDEGKHHHRPHDVVSQELPYGRRRGGGVAQKKKRRFSHTVGFFMGAGLKHLTERVNVQFVDEIPQPFNHILHLLHALPLKKDDSVEA